MERTDWVCTALEHCEDANVLGVFLLTSIDVKIRRAAAANPNTLPKALGEAILSDPNVWVRRIGVRNPNCPAEAIRRATRDPDKWVRGTAERRAPV